MKATLLPVLCSCFVDNSDLGSYAIPVSLQKFQALVTNLGTGFGRVNSEGKGALYVISQFGPDRHVFDLNSPIFGFIFRC